MTKEQFNILLKILEKQTETIEKLVFPPAKNEVGEILDTTPRTVLLDEQAPETIEDTIRRILGETIKPTREMKDYATHYFNDDDDDFNPDNFDPEDIDDNDYETQYWLNEEIKSSSIDPAKGQSIDEPATELDPQPAKAVAEPDPSDS